MLVPVRQRAPVKIGGVCHNCWLVASRSRTSSARRKQYDNSKVARSSIGAAMRTFIACYTLLDERVVEYLRPVDAEHLGAGSQSIEMPKL